MTATVVEYWDFRGSDHDDCSEDKRLVTGTCEGESGDGMRPRGGGVGSEAQRDKDGWMIAKHLVTRAGNTAGERG